MIYSKKFFLVDLIVVAMSVLATEFGPYFLIKAHGGYGFVGLFLSVKFLIVFYGLKFLDKMFGYRQILASIGVISYLGLLIFSVLNFGFGHILDVDRVYPLFNFPVLILVAAGLGSLFFKQYKDFTKMIYQVAIFYMLPVAAMFGFVLIFPDFYSSAMKVITLNLAVMFFALKGIGDFVLFDKASVDIGDLKKIMKK